VGVRYNPQSGTGQLVTIQQKLWLTADQDELVPDGDERSAFLFASPGDQVPVEKAEKFGLVDGALKAGKAKANKMADPPANKGAGGVVVDDGQPFDPSAHTAGEVVAYLAEAEKHEALRVLDAEGEGKKRSSVLAQRDAVEKRVQGDGDAGDGQ